MSDNKKYYYLKLKDNFFDSGEIIALESMPDGMLYVNILLKLYLRSLSREGCLMLTDRIPYNPTVLANVVRHPVAVVEKALTIFLELGLIEKLDTGEIYMLDIHNYIGESSTEADRIREYRNKIASRKELNEGSSTNDVTNDVTNVQQKNTIIRDRDRDRDKKTKHRYGDNVRLTDEEYKKLVNRFGEADAKLKIENLDDYIATHKKASDYTDHYRVILNWAKNDAKKKALAQQKPVKNDIPTEVLAFMEKNKNG